MSTSAPREQAFPGSRSDMPIVAEILVAGPADEPPVGDEAGAQQKSVQEKPRSVEPSDPDSAVRHPQDLIGRCIANRYVLESLLGSGATAWVFKARDLRKVEACASQPFVAIKILNLDLQRRPEARFGLEREAARAQQLVHPNLVAVYDFDRDGTLFYLVMEWLSGPTLDLYLRQMTPAARRSSATRSIIQGLITALQHAHSKGVIHGDLKPANIILDERGQPRVLDFGVARMVHAVTPQDGWSTGLNGYTPVYASYARLKGMNPSPQDDTYALACVIYELLAGRHPYDRRTALEARQQKLSLKRPQGLSRHQWQALARALAVDESHEDGLAVLADAFAVTSTARKSSGKGRWAWIALAALVVGLGLGRDWLADQAFIYEQQWSPDLQRLEDRLSALDEIRRLRVWLAVKPLLLEELEQKVRDYRRQPEIQALDDAYELAARMVVWDGQDSQLESSLVWLDQERIRRQYDAQRRETSASSGDASASLVPLMAGLIRVGRHEEARQEFASWMRLRPAHDREADIRSFQSDYATLTERLPAPLAQLGYREGARFFAEALVRVGAPENAIEAVERQALKLVDVLDRGENHEPALAQLRDSLVGLELDPLQYGRAQQRVQRLLQRQLAWYEPWGPVWTRYRAVAQSLLPDEQWSAPSGAGFACRDVAVGDLRLANVCRDWLTPLVAGPELVLVADVERQRSFYLGRREVSVGEFNFYCRLSRDCVERKAPDALPVTDISIYNANRYARWLQQMTGHRYRLPTAQEWALATNLGESAGACREATTVQGSGAGEADRAGFLALAGNVREWVTRGAQLRARGGDVWNQQQACSTELDVRHSGSPDQRTGFRLVREIR